MKIIIDRFEGEYAVAEIEKGTFANVPKNILPPNSKEGDVISIEIDKSETSERKQHITALMNNLFE